MMKYIYLPLLVFTIVACGGNAQNKKNKVDKKVLFGNMENRIYKNAFFNFQVELDEQWKLKEKYFRSLFGGALFEGEYINSEYAEYPLNIMLEADKANPFSKVDLIDKAEEAREGYDFLYDEDDIIYSPVRKQQIAEQTFVRAETLILTDGDTSFINDFVGYTDGYYLVITTIANTRNDQNKADAMIASFKKLK